MVEKESISPEDLFKDNPLILKIKQRLPKLFQIAEIESSRANKIGMEVGSLRERVIIALLIYKFGKENANTTMPITKSEVDVIVGGRNISIKTITGEGKIKAVWTVDAKSAKKFIDNYKPECDIILVQIYWGENKGGLFFIPLNVQKDIFKLLGPKRYFDMPKIGTNPRGVEFSKLAIQKMLSSLKILKIPINWQKEDIEYDVYERWIDYWEE